MPSLRRKPKTASSKAPAKAGPSRRERLSQIKTAFSITKQGDPKLVPLLLAAFLLPFALLLAIGFVLGHPVYLGILGLLVAATAVIAVFGRRMQKMQYSQVEGQPGAAAAVLQTIRGNWRVTPAVAFTREQDLVHRVIGLPGVVLVGEGNPNRVRQLISAEKRQLARIIGDTPVYDVQVGDGEGQLALRDLQKHFLKLPRNIKPARVNDLDRMLKAMKPKVPIPKGPVPTRVPRGKMR